jgi:cold shock CspA family protein
MPAGTVIRWVPHRGFGFITPDEGGEDIFVHISALKASGLDAPSEGDRLTYEIAPSQDGRLKATKLASAPKRTFP